MKQFTHIRLLATAALALSIGLVPLSARADNGGAGAAAAASSTAVSAAAGQASTSPETDGVIVTLTNKAERELQSLDDGRANGDISTLDSSSTFQELDQAGLDVTQQITTADGDIALEVQPEQGVSDQEALEDALELDSVESAQLNYVYNLIEPVIDEPLASAAAPTPPAPRRPPARCPPWPSTKCPTIPGPRTLIRMRTPTSTTCTRPTLSRRGTWPRRTPMSPSPCLTPA